MGTNEILTILYQNKWEKMTKFKEQMKTRLGCSLTLNETLFPLSQGMLIFKKFRLKEVISIKLFIQDNLGRKQPADRDSLVKHLNHPITLFVFRLTSKSRMQSVKYSPKCTNWVSQKTVHTFS